MLAMKSPKQLSITSSPGGGHGLANIEFSNAAVADLDAIDYFSIEQFGEEVAAKYMRGFDEAFVLLQNHPRAGHAEANFGKGTNCLTHRRHRIFYTIKDDTVFVVRIIHHA